jgi:hypothetical protein
MNLTLNKGQYEKHPKVVDVKLYEHTHNDGSKGIYLAVGKPNTESCFYNDILVIYPDGSITLDAHISLTGVNL